MNYLESQIQISRQKYLTINQQSPTVLTITFPNDPKRQLFKLTLPPDFPNRPPIILLNDKSLNVPMLSNWIPSFQLVQVFDHLDQLVKVPGPGTLTFDQQEVENAIRTFNPSVLSNESGKISALSQIPCMSRVLSFSQKADKSLQDLRPKLDSLQTQLISSSEKINQLNEEKMQYAKLAREKQQQVQEVQQIDTTKFDQAAEQSKLQSAALIQQYRSGQIRIEQMAKMFYEEKQKEYYNKVVARRITNGF